MKKTRAIFLLITLVVAIGGYVAWAVWEPAPTLQSMRFGTILDAEARSAAEADFRSHPPKARKMTWQRLLDRLAHPYQPRAKPWIDVGIFNDAGVAKLVIIYPREYVFLARSPEDGRWVRLDTGVTFIPPC
ncbi:MAG: hypothetical protein V4819_22365 [Verrucomicrobiota bacterium]